MEERVDRGDVDDCAAALVDHRGDGRAGRAQCGEEVQLEGELEVLVTHLEETFESELDAADVVHEHVDTAVPVDRLRDEALRPAGFDEVGCDGGHAVDSFQRVDSQRAAHDPHPFSDERMDDGEADSLAGASDDGDLAVESELHFGFGQLFFEIGLCLVASNPSCGIWRSIPLLWSNADPESRSRGTAPVRLQVVSDAGNRYEIAPRECFRPGRRLPAGRRYASSGVQP
jgi:hypothetical protein